jgi:hypothetical protein
MPSFKAFTSTPASFRTVRIWLRSTTVLSKRMVKLHDQPGEAASR